MATDTEYKYEISAFALKIIAILTMTCNHIANVFGESLPMGVRFPLYAIGGLTFPIMAFLIVEGYHRTSNLQKYMQRLLLFGLLSLFPFFWTLGESLNVLFTLLLGLVCLSLRDRMKNKPMFWVCFTGIVFSTVFCDWSLIGVPLIFAYGTVKGEKRRIILPAAAATAFGLLLIATMSLFFERDSILILMDCAFSLAGLVVIPLLLSYHGKRGYSPPELRYLFYVYYPAHLLVITGIKWLVI